MVQFMPIIFFLGFLKFLLGFSKGPFFFCVTLYFCAWERNYNALTNASMSSLIFHFCDIDHYSVSATTVV